MKTVPTLGSKNYNSDKNLLKRKAFATLFKPKIDLTKNIILSLKLKGKEKVLDVGCGNGDLLVELKRQYGHKGQLYGLDIASGILTKAIKANKENNLDIDFIVADGRKIPFPRDSFDAIIVKHVLHNVPNYPKIIAECHRV
ncbi:MAG: class I SAM-dependent methyltransferase, partial [Patescibacteria group bacterium]